MGEKDWKETDRLEQTRKEAQWFPVSAPLGDERHEQINVSEETEEEHQSRMSPSTVKKINIGPILNDISRTEHFIRQTNRERHFQHLKRAYIMQIFYE